MTGDKVKDGSLTGSDVDAASLGKVPDAAHADSADNANHATSSDRLGGSPPSAFVASADVQHVDWTPSGCQPTECGTPLIAIDGFGLEGICGPGSGDGELRFKVSATPNESSIETEGVQSPSGAFSTSSGAALGYIPLFLNGLSSPERADGQMILRSPAHTLTFLFHAEKTTPAGCKVFGTLLAS